MEKISARNLVSDTFQNSFDKDRFVRFIKELLNHIEVDDKRPYQGNFIPIPYRPYISTLDRVGKYLDPDDNKIDILVAKLKKSSSL